MWYSSWNVHRRFVTVRLPSEISAAAAAVQGERHSSYQPSQQPGDKSQSGPAEACRVPRLTLVSAKQIKLSQQFVCLSVGRITARKKERKKCWLKFSKIQWKAKTRAKEEPVGFNFAFETKSDASFFNSTHREFLESSWLTWLICSLAGAPGDEFYSQEMSNFGAIWTTVCSYCPKHQLE